MEMSKGWKVFLGAAAGLFTIAGAAALLLPQYRDLSLLFFYSIPANSFVPFPHETRAGLPWPVLSSCRGCGCRRCRHPDRLLRGLPGHQLRLSERQNQADARKRCLQGRCSLFHESALFCDMVRRAGSVHSVLYLPDPQSGKRLSFPAVPGRRFFSGDSRGTCSSR